MREDDKVNQASQSQAHAQARDDAKAAFSRSPVIGGAIKILIGTFLGVGAEMVREHLVHSHEGKPSKAEAPSTSSPEPSRRSVHLMRWISIAAVLVVVGVVTLLALGKLHGHAKKQSDLKAQVAKGPQLEVVVLKDAPLSHDLILEAEARPYYQTTIFAKVSGYLRDIRVIEGSKVKTGDVLGVIDSPETDQALESARADAINKNRIASRSRILLRQRFISAQEAEQAFAEARMATAQLRSAREQQDYEILRAPFDGIVTARLVDPGALIPNASNAKTEQLAVVNMAATLHLKIDAFVEQRYASDIYVGMPVEIYLPDRASEKYPAKVARVSGVLDPRTRMLFIEMDFDNSAGRIVAGSFVSVALKVRRPELLQAPIQALVSKSNAPALATLSTDNKIKMVPIQIYENDGTNVMISSGVTAGTKVVLDVGAELKDGDSIQPIFSDKDAKSGGPQQQQAATQTTIKIPSSVPQGGSNEVAQTAEGGSNALMSSAGGTVSGTTQSAQSSMQPQRAQQQLPQRDPRSTPVQYPAFAPRPPPPPTPSPAPPAPQQQDQQKNDKKDSGKSAEKKQKGTAEKPQPLEKSSSQNKQQAGGASKEKTPSGESQPKAPPQKPSMSNGVFLPPQPPEANE